MFRVSGSVKGGKVRRREPSQQNKGAKDIHIFSSRWICNWFLIINGSWAASR